MRVHNGFFLEERNTTNDYGCLVAKSCLTLCNPMDCSPPGSSGGISQARIHFLLQGIFPTQKLNPHLLHYRWILYRWVTWEAHIATFSFHSKHLWMGYHLYLAHSLKCRLFICIHTADSTEDKAVGWHHRLNGHEFEQGSGDGEGQGSLACAAPRGLRESHVAEWLNNR